MRVGMDFKHVGVGKPVHRWLAVAGKRTPQVLHLLTQGLGIWTNKLGGCALLKIAKHKGDLDGVAGPQPAT